jgi:adenosylcobinamide kinase/adenosylcobinamide-phosphate guanylyltransferase
MQKRILILGGARSGKSHYAQEIALKSLPPVLFVATAEAGDEEMKQRIEEHQKARPATWHTLEATTHIGRKIKQRAGKAQTVIIDCITLLVSNILTQHGHPTGELIEAPLIEQEVMAEINELTEYMNQIKADFIIISNEVGLGLVPANSMSRLYRDLLGKVNQLLAEQCNEVYLMVAGLPLRIKPARNQR